MASSRDGARSQEGIAGRDPAARRWQEWVITLSILALAGIGVGAIWGTTIRTWVNRMRGETPSTQPAQVGPAGGGPRL